MDDGGNSKQQSMPDHFENDDDSNEEILLEVISQDQYGLSYTFFIIPELPSFELTGKLVDFLPEWLNCSPVLRRTPILSGCRSIGRKRTPPFPPPVRPREQSALLLFEVNPP